MNLLRVNARDLPVGFVLPSEYDAALVVGDAVHEVLPRLAPRAIGAVITDPPYSSGGAFRGDRAKGTAEKYLQNNATNAAGVLPDFFGDTRDGLGHLYWLQFALSLAWGVTRESGFLAVFSDWRQVPACAMALQGAGWSWRGMRPWVKDAGFYRQFYHYPHPDAEFVLWGTRGPAETPDLVPSVQPPAPWSARAPKGAQKRHQTEKPLQIMRDLCRVAHPDDVILDPFAGSGTTMEAALLEGRRVIGCELSPEYAEVIEARLMGVRPEAAKSGEQTAMFGGLQ